MIDSITQIILEKQIVQKDNYLTEDWYKVASFFKDVPLVGKFARQYTIGHDIARVTTVAAGVLVAVMAALAYKVYKKKFSAAAKDCKQYKGQTKESCMKKYKEESIKLQIKAYESMISKCKFSKEPEKCKKLATNKIQKLKAKIGNYVYENEDLRVFASYYVELQDNLNNSDKKIFFDFIQNANDAQIENLLVCGQIKENMLEISGEDVTPDQMIKLLQLKVALEKIKKFGTDKVEISEDSFKTWISLIKRFGEELKTVMKPGKIMKTGMKVGAEKGVVILGGTLLAALVLTVSFKAYKQFLSKAARQCRNQKGRDKNVCMEKFRRISMKKRVELLEAGKQTCKFSKNPAKCTFKIDKKINKIKLKLGTLHI